MQLVLVRQVLPLIVSLRRFLVNKPLQVQVPILGLHQPGSHQSLLLPLVAVAAVL